jgi:hypothetical protein
MHGPERRTAGERGRANAAHGWRNHKLLQPALLETVNLIKLAIAGKIDFAKVGTVGESTRSNDEERIREQNLLNRTGGEAAQHP